jgi:hypothetical protein
MRRVADMTDQVLGGTKPSDIELGARESIIADRRRKIMTALQVGSNAQFAAKASRLAFWPNKNE